MSTTTAFSDALISTGGAATTTVWLPLTTAYPYVSGCSQDIYKPGAGSIFAWDPLSGSTIRPASTPCLPREVASSYWQGTVSQTNVVTLLGPVFQCPAAYVGVETLIVSTTLQQTLCCPSYFTLNVPLTTGGFPSQCISSITSGQVVSYLTASGGAPSSEWKMTTVTESAATTMLAIHVNGFNAIATTSSTASQTTSSTATTTSTISAASSSTTSAVSNSGSSKLSSGAAAGIGVGATVVIVAIVAVAFFFWRRRKNNPKSRAELGTDSVAPVPENHYSNINAYGNNIEYGNWKPPGEMSGDEVAHEMENSPLVNEMPVKEVRHEMYA